MRRLGSSSQPTPFEVEQCVGGEGGLDAADAELPGPKEHTSVVDEDIEGLVLVAVAGSEGPDRCGVGTFAVTRDEWPYAVSRTPSSLNVTTARPLARACLEVCHGYGRRLDRDQPRHRGRVRFRSR